MRNEIDKAFEITRKENRPALISFTVAGDNTKKKSLEILKSISQTGRNNFERGNKSRKFYA